MSEQTHAHAHAHGHQHTHGHSHDHHHGEEDSYFIDQLCMVGLSGAFGVICLCLYFWQTEMLRNLLAPQFHLYVLLSGIALTIIAFTRGAVLWQQSRDPAFRPARDHHHHDHSHDHHHHDHSHPNPPESSGATAIQSAPAHVHGPACTHDHAPEETGGHEPHEHHIGHAHVHHDHDEADHDHGWAPWRYVVILVPIILFLLGLPNREPQLGDQGHERLLGDFISIIYEAMPFIVLGVLIAGLLEEFVPQQAIAKIVPKNPFLAISIGCLLGLVFPMCECGIIVVMKRLLRKGLPLSVCVAYMLAGPVINVIVMTSTFVAFQAYGVLGGGLQVVAWRVGLAYLVAMGTALIVEWQWRRHGTRLLHPSIAHGLKHGGADENNTGAKRPWGERINNITQTALHDYVDILAFLILGAVLAVAGKYMIGQGNLQETIQQTPAVAILAMMGIAVLFCLCSEADAFVAANFPLFWPDGSKLAFLVLGPMLDLKLLLMYTRVYRARLIYTIVIALVIQVFAYTMVVEAFFGVDHPKPVPHVEVSPTMNAAVFSAGLGPDPLGQIAHYSVAFRPSGKGDSIPYKTFYEIAEHKDLREQWKDRVVEVRGLYEPTSNAQAFGLCRFKMTCCGNDVQTVRSHVVVMGGAPAFRQNDYVSVTGRVDFREVGGRFIAILIVADAADIVLITPPGDRYYN